MDNFNQPIDDNLGYVPAMMAPAGLEHQPHAHVQHEQQIMNATARMQVPSKSAAAPKYKKAPDAPKRFKSAFIIFSAEKHKIIKEELAKEGRSEKTTDIAKLVSEAWRELNPEEKEIWEKKARKDKARYEVEKSMYKGPWKVPANKRTPKDPTAPKRPMSAFLAFSNKRRAALKRQHPDATNADLSKMLSKTWKEAPEELRRKYMDEEAELRQTYKVEMAKWRKKVAEEKKAERKEREAMAMQTAENRANEAARNAQNGGAPLDMTQDLGAMYGSNYFSPQQGGMGAEMGYAPQGVGGQGGPHGQQAPYPGMQGGYPPQQILQQILAGQQMGRMGGPMNGYGMPAGQFNGQQSNQFGPPATMGHGMGSAGGNFGMDVPPPHGQGMESPDIKDEPGAGGDNGGGSPPPDGMGYDQQQNFAPSAFGRGGQEGNGGAFDDDQGGAV
mmetsp:Transcript_8057/g.22371  ORF Transcript_8057/g.22371 Transcript_8057/m.22371 type:complete len:443 (+) Transcript_8057:103-1431(+)